MHLDPLGTSAWNASIKGHKLWLLLPPEISRSIVKSKDLIKKGEDDEAIIYMKDIFPRIKEKYGADLKEMWFIQNPGDLIFVPGGWWHAVVNLDDTVAVTQNYCNSVNFSRVWTHVRSERKKMAVKFLKKLQKYKPEIYELAININKTDQFLMYDELKKFYQNKKTEKAENKDKYRATSGSSSSSSSSSDSDSSTSSYLTDN